MFLSLETPVLAESVTKLDLPTLWTVSLSDEVDSVGEKKTSKETTSSKIYQITVETLFENDKKTEESQVILTGEAEPTLLSSNDNYVIENGILLKYNGNEDKVVIPNTVTSIGNRAFYNCCSMSSVYIPDSVTSIGEYSFSECWNLKNFTVPNSVKSFGDGAFQGCESLTTFTVPNNITSIGKSLFSGCKSLVEIVIPSSVTTIEEMAFQGCNSLTTLIIPKSVTHIGNQAFSSCSKLNSINIPNSVVSIGTESFSYCESLNSVSIPKSVTFIGEKAFFGCSNLESVSIPNSITCINDGTFGYCYRLTNVIIPNSVISIGELAFNHCYGITNLTIPDSVTKIGGGAFWYCIGLLAVDIPDSVTFLGDSVFYECTSLVNVKISNSINKFGKLLFYNCGNLTEITIPNSVVTLGDEAFSYCKSLTCVTIPNSVTNIGSRVFYGCTNLIEISIPSSVLNIGSFSFSCCSSLQSVSIPNSVTNIGEYAFYGCKGIKHVIISNSLTTLSNGTFCECTALTNVSVPNSVTVIGDKAFYKCLNLESIFLPDTVTSFGEESFAYCQSLSNVKMPNATLVIGKALFSYCTNLESIVVPDSIKCIGERAFEHCIHLANIVIPSSLYSIGDRAFQYCSTLSFICLSNKLSNIGEYVFDGCDNLIDIYYSGSKTAWQNLIKIDELIVINLGIDENLCTIHFFEITMQPKNNTVKLGDNLSISLLADGYKLNYQWYYKKVGQVEWNVWKGHNSPFEKVIPNQTWNGIQLYCVVNDYYGIFLKSTIITITIVPNLKITAQPTDKTVKLGESLTLSVKAEGTGLTYQWYYKKSGATSFSKWNGRTHASETVTPNASWDGIQLYCTVKDSSGNSLDSSVAKITVTQDLKITAQPTNKTIKKGDSVTLSLKAEGNGLTYQWYYKKAGAASFSKWNGRTHATETATPNTTWNGIQLYCIVKDSAGKSVQSNTVKVNFSDVVTIVTQPSDVTIKTGDNVTFKFVAEGVGLTYQWYYKKAGATAWSKWGARTTASTTATSNATWDGMQVYCVVKDSSGNSLNSNTAKITLSDVLAITQQPTNVTTQAGKNVTFTVKAKGAGLTYQWYYKKSGQTSWNQWGARTTASTTATANATWNGMQVRCVVKDSTGKTVTSSAATITIK